MKSLGTFNIYDALVSNAKAQYSAVVKKVAEQALADAATDRDTLVDAVTYHVAYHVDELVAPFILSASPRANEFLKVANVFEDISEWQLIFQAVAQCAMEADVHHWILLCQEDKALEAAN